MRDLGSNLVTATVNDGSAVHVFKYRRPTNEELVAYNAGLFKKVGRKIKNRTHEMRLKFGLKVLEGFEKGTLSVDGKVISSDPGDVDFFPTWRELLQSAAPDIVSAIGAAAFEGVQVMTDDGGIELDTGEDEPGN